MINQDNYSSYAKTNPAREELIAKFQEPRFNYFTSFIDISYIKNKVMLSTFVKMFDKYYDLIETLLNEEDIQKFNNYIFNQKDFDFPFNVDTFYQDRINFIKKNINNNKIDRINRNRGMSISTGIQYYTVVYSNRSMDFINQLTLYIGLKIVQLNLREAVA